MYVNSDSGFARPRATKNSSRACCWPPGPKYAFTRGVEAFGNSMDVKPGTTNVTVSVSSGDTRHLSLRGSGTSPVSPAATAMRAFLSSESQRGRSIPASQPTITRNSARASGLSSFDPTPRPITVDSICSTRLCNDSCCTVDVSRGKTRRSPGLQRSPSSAHAARLRYINRSRINQSK